MSSMKKSAKKAMTRGRKAAVRVGKVAKSAAVVGAKAGAKTAIAAGTLEAGRKWKETKPMASKLRTKKGMAALLAGAAVLSAAGVMISKSRSKN